MILFVVRQSCPIGGDPQQHMQSLADFEAQKRAILASIGCESSPKRRRKTESEVTLGVLEVHRARRAWMKLVEHPFLFNDPRLVVLHTYLKKHCGDYEIEGADSPIVEGVVFGVLEIQALLSVWSKLERNPALFKHPSLRFFAESLPLLSE